MDKKTMKLLIQIIVVVIALSFLTEIFYFKGSLPSFDMGDVVAQKNISGTAIFNGTIRTYDPLLAIAKNTSASVLDQLRKREDVKDVQLDQDSYVITPDTRYDVFALASYLRTLNVSSLSIANVVLPQKIEVETANGTINASSEGVVRIPTEPLVDVDTEVTVSMSATVADGVLISYNAPSIQMQQLSLQLDGTIAQVNSNIYSYAIPWENRTLDLSSYGDVKYNRVDSVIFKTPLNVTQIMAKKAFPYVTFISADSATVEKDFSNITELETNFADTPYTLPPSTLRITANETPDIPFNATVRYRYMVSTNSTYDFGDFTMESDKQYSAGDSVKVGVQATTLGNRILSITSVSFPS